jgi:MerR family transcriptional regulator/heat shock protein HspR
MPSEELERSRGVYGISVAAELVGMGVHTLRLYERRGLVEPQRTPAGTRRYSEEDLTRLRRIAELLAGGLNLAGVALVLELETDNARLRADLEQTQADSTQLRVDLAQTRADSAQLRVDLAQTQADSAQLRADLEQRYSRDA